MSLVTHPTYPDRPIGHVYAYFVSEPRRRKKFIARDLTGTCIGTFDSIRAAEEALADEDRKANPSWYEDMENPNG